MMRLIPCFLVFVASALAADFAPPQAYPRDRYEAGWQKNPFTLKTTPPVKQVESFAKDLALSSISGTSADPVVVVVNTKTHERTTLRSGDAARKDQTMTIKSIHSDAPRKDRYVEVEMAGQVAEIHYDENLIKVASAGVMGAAGTANPAGGAGRPGMPVNGAMSQPGVVTPLPGQAPTTGNRSTVPMSYAKMPTNMSSTAPPPMTNTGIPAGVNVPVDMGQPKSGEAAPFVQRRRFSGVPQPAVPAPSQPSASVNP